MVRTRMAGLALAWVLAYGALQAYWRVGGRPGRLSPVGADLVVFSGWGAVGLCAAAALALLGLRFAGAGGVAGRVVLGAAWAAALGLVASGALLLLDVVGGLLPGMGIEFFPVGALSRAACVGAGVLVGLAALTHQRRARPGCPGCGRPASARDALRRTPGWVFGAAYLAVAGCVTRVAAQAWVGFGESPLTGGVSAALFEVGFLLAGTLLPLALAHSWGRVWPRWVPGLAGRPVPRRLVLWPGAGVSAGMLLYFGLMLLQMVWERLNGRPPFPPEGGLHLPEAFFWISVPAYVLWAAGMAVAAAGYARRTRTPCPACTK